MKKITGKLVLIFLPLLVAAFLLYPTYRASRLEDKENEAKAKASKFEETGQPEKALEVMDAFNKMYGEDLQKAKESRLKLGLDLRGGMYVTLEVDVIKLIEESAVREAIDDVFLEIIEKTRNEAIKSDEDALDIFLRYFDKYARPKGKSLISYFDIGDVREASEEKIIEKLKANSANAIDQALEVIRQRIDKYGVSEPNVQKQGARRILLELPGVTDEKQMRNLLQTTARLEFKLVRNNETIIKIFAKIDKILAQQYKRASQGTEVKPAITDTVIKDTSVFATSKTKKDTTQISDIASTDTSTADTTVAADTTNPYSGLSDDEALRRFQADHPFTILFATYFLPPGKNQRPVLWQYIRKDPPEGEYIFRISGDSIKKFNAILSKPEIKSLIPFDLSIEMGAKPLNLSSKEKIEVFEFFCLKRDPELTGDVVTDAYATFDPSTNVPEVVMIMNTDGADRWGKITGANIGKRIAIVLDGRVYSAPNVMDKILGGRSSITGMSGAEEANLLEIVLKAGALKAPVQIIEERVVGPSLGEDSINSGVVASIIAVILVILYMALYYNKAGFIADFAVLLNVTLIISVLAAFGGTLTLPGIAGIILTIGMAVDANVLIFERIREELFKGRSLKSAVDEGFQKALSAILDSNITTFITGLILFYFGSGPIQGFAMTLMIGILGTLFTGILVSRAILEIFIIRGSTEFSFGQSKLVKA